MTRDPAPFADPWEHTRLLADTARTDALLGWLAAWAPGQRVLEVGCGPGLLTVAAVRCGAVHAIGVEPTGTLDVARALVADNGLGDRITLLEGRVQDLEARPVDVAFGELLNADPFVEGIMQAMAAAASWVGEGALAPSRLRVGVAPLRNTDAAREKAGALAALGRVRGRLDLELGALATFIGDAEGDRWLARTVRPVGPVVPAWDLRPGLDPMPEDPVDVDLSVPDGGPVDAVVLVFEADLPAHPERGGGAVLHNRPGTVNHWEHQILGLASPLVPRGGRVRVRLYPDDDEGVEAEAYPRG